MRSWCPCQDLLVLWISVRTGAGLAVLWSANSGLTEETSSALLTELSLSVVQTALEGEREKYFVFPGCHKKSHKTSISVVLCTVQMPVSGWQESEWPLHSQSSQWPKYRPPPVRVYPDAQSLKRQRYIRFNESQSVTYCIK